MSQQKQGYQLPISKKKHKKNSNMAFSKVIKWKVIKTNIPLNLKISPVAAIPQKSRMFRFVLDLSFAIKMTGIKNMSVN